MPTVYLSTSELATESQVTGPSGSSLELSPADIPRSATVELEHGPRRLLSVRFSYSDREPATERNLDGVTVQVGKHSGKLLALHTTCSQHDTAPSVGMRLAVTLRKEADEARRDNQRLHYTLLSHLFDQEPFQAVIDEALSAKT